MTPRRPWRGRRVVLGVSGGIAAYKSVQVARDLTRLGCVVDVVLTEGATRFVQPLSFEGVTGRPVHTHLFQTDGAALHIRLGQDADAVCVAPATADLLARAAQGRADDLLTTTLLVTRAPVVLCPAMNTAMWEHPQTAANVRHLADVLGYRIAGPGTGALAHGEASGAGRMLEPDDIVAHVGRALESPGPLHGRSVLITAGPTREPLDPVRYLGNRSSGRMGWALAEAAWRRGAEVTLIAGPTALPDPVGVRVERVERAEEMLEAASHHVPHADVLIFAAAVADYRPRSPAAQKLKRERGAPTVDTVENPDVAASLTPLRKSGSFAVGFALETEDLVERARGKLARKGFDLIVANPADEPDAGLDVETNRATLVAADGSIEAVALMPKTELAELILDRVGAARSRLPA
ncbi:MAG: bifunctional phosphopantothenoylcysteine decarboxylase/phosphopantothenate--cysteine ligase CoaBC [Gemmatimonadetes bacterium]|nr:bifunctional phosphopantothenoylcysteine decarboxylase/phosphopantothenate--cysteine ligase CoaBC [Gemmatimonadota bacterium]